MKKTNALNLLMLSILMPTIVLPSFRSVKESDEITFSFYGDVKQTRRFGEPAKPSQEELAFYRDNQQGINQTRKASLCKKQSNGAEQFMQAKEDEKYNDAKAINKIGYKKPVTKSSLLEKSRVVIGSTAYAAIKNIK